MTDQGHICFSGIGLEELPKKQQKDMYEVARRIAKEGRFSVFDATATRALARTMDRIGREGWFTNHPLGGFPWVGVTLTDKGREALEKKGASCEVCAAPPCC
jgi:hypothetical protein